MLLKQKIYAFAAVLLMLPACKEDNGQNNMEPQIPVVGAVRLEPQNVPLSFEFSARAQGSKETEVRARVGGILLKRNYVEGSAVKEGDILFSYRLFQGRTQSRNAIKLLELMGYDKKIVDSALSCANNFLETGQWKM